MTRILLAAALLLGCGAGPGSAPNGCSRAYRRCLNGVQGFCTDDGDLLPEPTCISREMASCWQGQRSCLGLQQ